VFFEEVAVPTFRENHENVDPEEVSEEKSAARNAREEAGLTSRENEENIDPEEVSEEQSAAGNARGENEENIDPEEGSGGDPGQTRLVQSRDNNRQQSFREELLKESEPTCCVVTGCELTAVLEAAHISGSYHDGYKMCNGFLLRVDIHRLLDAFLWSIDKDMKIILSIDLLEDPYYKKFHGELIKMTQPMFETKRVELNLHYEKFVGKEEERRGRKVTTFPKKGSNKSSAA
jgi:hypothetical protein